MTIAPRVRPKMPPVTVALAAFGVVAIIAGATKMFTSGTGCVECKPPSRLPELGLIVWGLIASVSVIRSRVGLWAMIAAIVLPLAIAWRYFLPVLAWLLVVMAVVGASKERLAPYYRSHEESA